PERGGGGKPCAAGGGDSGGDGGGVCAFAHQRAHACQGRRGHRHVFHHGGGHWRDCHFHDRGHGRGQRLYVRQDPFADGFGRGDFHRPVRSGAGDFRFPLPSRVCHYL